MKTAFLLGAGASKDAAPDFPLAADLTSNVLKDGFGLLTQFENSPFQPEAFKSTVGQNILPFLGWMKEQVDDAFATDGRTANYEDLAYMAEQIHDHLIRNFENPAIEPLIQKVPLEIRFLPQATTGERADQLELLSQMTVEYVRGVVSRSLSRWPTELEHLRFLIEFPNASVLNIFTLNNDTLVEQFLLKEGKDFIDGFEPSIGTMDFAEGIASETPAMARWNPASLEQDAGLGVIRLFKLHGSINWFRYRPNPEIARDEFHRVGLRQEGLRKFMKLPPANRPDLNLPELLVGTFNKLLRYTSSLYHPLHYGFRRELQSTDRLIVCGYSVGDKGINEQIASWLDGEPHRRVAIVDACTEEVLWKNARGLILMGRERWTPNKQLVLCLGEKLKCVDWNVVWREIS